MVSAEIRRRPLVNVKDVAALTGLPRSSIYDRARAGKLPGVVRVGTRLLFDLDKLEPWLDAGGDTQEGQ